MCYQDKVSLGDRTLTKKKKKGFNEIIIEGWK